MSEASESLRSAILKGDIPGVIQALSSGADVNLECPGAAGTMTRPLNMAAGNTRQENRLAILETLVESGAEVNSVDTCGISPLASAATGQAWECVTALLVLGAEPDEQEQSLIAPTFFPERARRSEFKAMAERLQQVCGSKGLLYHGQPGTLTFAVKAGEWAAREIQNDHYVPAIRCGSLLLDSMNADTRGHFLYLLPDHDKFAAMSAVGVNDWPDGHGPMGLIRGFRALDRELSFSLMACSQKSLELRFDSEQIDNATIVQRLNTIFARQKRSCDMAPLLHAESHDQNTLIYWAWDS